MNRKIIAPLAALAILALPSLSIAETLPLNETEIQTKITALLAKMSDLQGELNTAKENTSILQSFHLIETLKRGTRSDEVKTLQTLLSKDSEVYPKGFVTGYYGKLTAAAVVRFQSKHRTPELTVESLTVPHISDISATTTKTAMTINWKTDMPTSAKIWWGSPGPLDPLLMTPISTAGFSENHQAVFSGIIYASTTYAFVIAVSDKDGNTSTTTEQLYITP